MLRCSPRRVEECSKARDCSISIWNRHWQEDWAHARGVLGPARKSSVYCYSSYRASCVSRLNNSFLSSLVRSHGLAYGFQRCKLAERQAWASYRLHTKQNGKKRETGFKTHIMYIPGTYWYIREYIDRDCSEIESESGSSNLSLEL